VNAASARASEGAAAGRAWAAAALARNRLRMGRANQRRVRCDARTKAPFCRSVPTVQVDPEHIPKSQALQISHPARNFLALPLSKAGMRSRSLALRVSAALVPVFLLSLWLAGAAPQNAPQKKPAAQASGHAAPKAASREAAWREVYR